MPVIPVGIAFCSDSVENILNSWVVDELSPNDILRMKQLAIEFDDKFLNKLLGRRPHAALLINDGKLSLMDVDSRRNVESTLKYLSQGPYY